MKLLRLTLSPSFLTTLFFTVAMSFPSLAQSSPDAPSTSLSFHDDSWHVSVSPYLWLAGMNGSVGVGDHEVQVNQSFTDIFSNLKFGIMGLTDVRRGRIGFLTDAMWIKLGNETAIPLAGLPNAIDIKTSLNTFTLTPYFGYRIIGGERGAIDWIMGGRYYHIGSTISADLVPLGSKSYSASNNWADFVQGGRFTLNVTRRIGAFFIGDAGGGGSVLTYQIAGGGKYRLSKRWSADLGYRRLYFNRQTSKGFGLEQTQQGIVLGATFRVR